MAIRDEFLDRLFLEARTPKKWHQSRVSETQLRQLYDLVRMGPTSNNSSPLRVSFVVSPEGHHALLKSIHAGNHPKVENAPVICILSYDELFWQFWPTLSPHKDLEAIFACRPEGAGGEALRSALLQAGYFIVAARALGLDAFPLQGFDPEAIEPWLLNPGWKPFLLCCLGQGDPSALRPRAARLSFEQACSLV